MGGYLGRGRKSGLKEAEGWYGGGLEGEWILGEIVSQGLRLVIRASRF